MPFYRLDFAFNGTRYLGWQRQTDDQLTVQLVLENMLRCVFQEPDLNLCGSSRTDTGVHALNMTVSFHAVQDLAPEIILPVLEKRLPHDIRINALSYAPDGFHAQHSACGKAYVYAVYPGKYNLFMRDLCWSWQDVSRMDCLHELLPYFVGTHDFSGFTGRDMSGENPVRTITRAELYQFGPVSCIYFSGTGFLYKMVRRIVSILHEAAAGRISFEDVKDRIERPQRPEDNDTPPAPPEGLYLKKVFYSAEEMKEDTLEYLPFLT